MPIFKYDMQTVCIIDCIGATRYMREPFVDGISSFDIILAFAERESDHVVVFTSDEQPIIKSEQLKLLTHPSWTMELFLSEIKTIVEKTCGKGAGVLLVRGDAPLTDAALTGRLKEIFSTYHADYVFADGYPAGFAPELLDSTMLDQLIALARQHNMAYTREGLFPVLQKDINIFDIETELAPVDLRPFRCVPVCNSKRNFLTAKRLYNEGARDAKTCAELLPRHEAWTRSLPAFFSIQITETCPQACSYCPYPLMRGDPRVPGVSMKMETFSRIIDDICRFAEDAVIDLSLWGEPALHPEIEELVTYVLAKDELTLLIETSGIGWQSDALDRMLKAAADAGDKRRYSPFEGPRLQFIVSLDAQSKELYEKLRGAGFEEAEAFVGRLLAEYPAGTHIQAVRMRENEAELEDFYRRWKKTAGHVIIQGYEGFAGSLPDRRVCDITPVKRFACRHLARDMSILLDGRVPVCKYALSKDTRQPLVITGNVLDIGVDGVWQSMQSFFEQHCAAAYPDFCRDCNEYYTYNA